MHRDKQSLWYCVHLKKNNTAVFVFLIPSCAFKNNLTSSKLLWVCQEHFHISHLNNIWETVHAEITAEADYLKYYAVDLIPIYQSYKVWIWLGKTYRTLVAIQDMVAQSWHQVTAQAERQIHATNICTCTQATCNTHTEQFCVCCSIYGKVSRRTWEQIVKMASSSESSNLEDTLVFL